MLHMHNGFHVFILNAPAMSSWTTRHHIFDPTAAWGALDGHPTFVKCPKHAIKCQLLPPLFFAQIKCFISFSLNWENEQCNKEFILHRFSKIIRILNSANWFPWWSGRNQNPEYHSFTICGTFLTSSILILASFILRSSFQFQ